MPLLISGLSFLKKYVMNFALYENQKVSAEEYKKSDNLDLRCPCCNSEVVAKQGEINIWHFAHKVKNRCSEWFKPMTEWHSNWQKCFPNECREVIHKCEKTGEKHIADIKTNSGIVIEFQHSSISSKEIKAREEFYGEKMIWVLDGNSFNIEFKNGFKFEKTALQIINQYKHLLKFKTDILVKKLNCEPDKCLDILEKKLNDYILYQSYLKIISKKKFFEISNNPIFIDKNDEYLYLIKHKENEKFIGYQEFTDVTERQSFYFVKLIDEIKNTTNELLDYDEKLIYDEFKYNIIEENLKKVKDKFSDMLFLRKKYFFEGTSGFYETYSKYISCVKISKQKFLEKYATHETTSNLQTKSLY